jgi:hypothetical protein
LAQRGRRLTRAADALTLTRRRAHAALDRSTGGLRPKCTILEEDGRPAIGKFPSIGDDRSVMLGEVLALALARRAGIVTAAARIVTFDKVPAARRAGCHRSAALR